MRDALCKLPHCAPITIRGRKKFDHASSRTGHLFDETFLANKFHAADLAVFIQSFDLFQFANRDVSRVVCFFNTRTQKLRFEGLQSIRPQTPVLHFK